MLHHSPNNIRRIALCGAAAIAIALPGAAMAGPFDNAKNLVHKTAAQVGKTVKAARKNGPLAKALRKTAGNLPGSDLIEMVEQLGLVEQLRDTIALMQQMQIDYRHFSGGLSGCEAECKIFRSNLKTAFDDYLALVQEVPFLNAKPGLFENIARVGDLIDYVPPRALYLMWQALEGQIDEFRTAPAKIRQLLALLPPLTPPPDIATIVGTAASTVSNSAFCEWEKLSGSPVVELVQAELERIAWVIHTVEGFVPDIEIKAEAGAAAGVAATAGIGAKPTDGVKVALKVLGMIPEAINWTIKINTLRAKVACGTADTMAK